MSRLGVRVREEVVRVRAACVDRDRALQDLDRTRRLAGDEMSAALLRQP